MNHTIIKKALNEALTQKYYDELMKTEDEEHIFGVGFTADMKRLIRKTDDKLLYYSKYVAIAACACIAIGCAVLLPSLMNSGIRTEPPVITTPVIDSDPESVTTTPEDTSLPIIITTTEGTTTVITTAPDETTLDTDSSVTSEVTTAPTETTTTPTTTTEEKVTETKPDDDADAEGDIVDDDTDADIDSDTPDYDGDVIIDAEEGDDAVILPDDDDVSTDSDDDVVVEEDDEVEIEDDCDVEEEDDVEIEDDTNPDSDGIQYPEGNTLKEIYEFYTSRKLEDTKACNVTINSAVDNNQIFLNGCIYDLSFVSDYIISQADAERLDKIAENSGNEITGEGRSIFVELGEGELTNKVDFWDSSRRNNYGEFFRGEFSEDEDDVDAETESFTYLTGIKIYENGAAFYRGCVPMQFDPAATAELFKRFDKIGLPDYAASVSEIIDYTKISHENIIGGVAKINNVYDIGISGVEINTKEEIEGLYDIIDSLKELPCVPGSGNGQVEIKFYVSETLSAVRLVISDPFTAKPNLFIISDTKTYVVGITQKKAHEIISYICKCAGVAEPYFYVKAEEYLDYVGVDFADVKEISARGEINGIACTYRITAPEKIKKLTDMVLNELKNTRYTGSGSSRTWLYADFEMEHWTLSLCEGYIKVGPYAASQFEISGDILKKVNEYIAANADETVMEKNEVEVDHDVEIEEDVAIEDEIDE